MVENIKKLWEEISNKTEFIKECAKEVKRSPKTLRHHWFSNAGFWSIPEDKQERVVELLQKTIKRQNEIKQIEVKETEL